MSDLETAEYRQYRYSPPPGAATLLLVRHGESAPVRPGKPVPMRDGHADPPLDPVGERQAEALANRLADEAIDAIVVTPLQRTAQTAAPLAGRIGVTPTVEPGLREVFLGEWEGGTFRRNTAERHPLALKMFAEERWDVVPGAEPADAFAARIHGAVARVAEAHPDERVVVVVHGGVIGMALALATGSRAFAFIGADNASVSELVVLGDAWTVRRFNDTAHLSGLAD